MWARCDHGRNQLRGGLERDTYLMQAVTGCAQACHAGEDGTLRAIFEYLQTFPPVESES